MRQTSAIAFLVVCLLPAAAAFAGRHDVVVHVTRLGGDSASAQPYLDRFLRYLESQAGWPAGSAKGSFTVTRKEMTSYISSAEPGIGMLEPQAYIELKKGLNLEPIVQVESKDLVSDKFHLVVKDPAIKSLADLKGKRLWTTLADYPGYLSKVVLGGQVQAASHFELKQIGQALKGVRGVLRGDCDATVLDDEQLAKAREIEGGKDLRTIHSSERLPHIPIVAIGTDLPAAERATLIKVFTGLCGTEKGAAICKEMHIERFVPINAAVFRDAEKRFGQ
ncbi:MAG: PhnD/SsuA/transferrin family substrate-binding protein [Deltaproteobacteria bacterium]|nr:PhnD/SsuA/transferrin family substrate-binding protein [Deltaproteobacteria bacterium]